MKKKKKQQQKKKTKKKQTHYNWVEKTKENKETKNYMS